MNKCPKCGTINDYGANYCSECGYNYTNKISAKKKKTTDFLIAFLIIFVIFDILFLVLISRNGNDSNDVNPTNSSQNDTLQQSNGEKVYGLGDTVTIHTSRGDYALKFTGVRETDKRNEYADENPQRVVILEYEYKNISFDTDVVVSYLYLRTYDNDGNALTLYPDTSVKSTTNISQGKTATASVAYGLDDDDNIITVDFYDITMENMYSAECSFKLTW